MITGNVVKRLAVLSLRPVSRWMLSNKGPIDARMGLRFRPTRITLTENRREDAGLVIFQSMLLP
ncbi:hypothetical protein D3C80_1558470 [compost metagenome]